MEIPCLHLLWNVMEWPQWMHQFTFQMTANPKATVPQSKKPSLQTLIGLYRLKLAAWIEWQIYVRFFSSWPKLVDIHMLAFL